MQAIHDIINYSTSVYPFESGKFAYLENEKSFLDEIKKSYF